MSKQIYLAAEVSEDEAKRFEEHCAALGVKPEQKIAQLIESFVLSEGVKHREGGTTLQKAS